MDTKELINWNILDIRRIPQDSTSIQESNRFTLILWSESVRNVHGPFFYGPHEEKRYTKQNLRAENLLIKSDQVQMSSLPRSSLHTLWTAANLGFHRAVKLLESLWCPSWLSRSQKSLVLSIHWEFEFDLSVLSSLVGASSVDAQLPWADHARPSKRPQGVVRSDKE